MYKVIKTLIVICLCLSFSNIGKAQNSVKLKVSQKEQPDEKYSNSEKMIELSEGQKFIVGITKNMMLITRLSKNLDQLGVKEIELFEKREDFEISSWKIHNDMLHVVLKDFIKSEKLAMYYLKIVDPSSGKIVGGIKNLGSFTFETKKEADYHSLSLKFANDAPYIINMVKGDEEYSAPLYEIIYLDEDFKVKNKLSFKLKKNKPTDADYLLVKNVFLANNKYFFLVECAGKVEKKKFADLYPMIYVANDLGEIENKVPLPKQKEVVYGNFNWYFSNNNIYLSSTYAYSGKEKLNGGFYFGVFNVSTEEMVNSSFTPLDKVFNMASLNSHVKNLRFKSSINNPNSWIVNSEIYAFNNSFVVKYSAAYDYSVTHHTRDASYTVYFRISISDPLLKYDMDGNFLKKAHIQKKVLSKNENRVYATTSIVQISDNRLLAFYGLSTKSLINTPPLDKELNSDAGEIGKKNTCVYSIIDENLAVSKPKEVMTKDAKNPVFITGYFFNVYIENDQVQIIQVDHLKKKRLYTIIKVE